MKKKKDWVTRDKIREKESNINLIEEVFKTIYHLLPNFRYELLNVVDNRVLEKITYKTDVMLFTRILSAICAIESMNSMTKKFNNENVINNVNKFLNSNYENLPHYTSINEFLKKTNPSELEKVNTKLIKQLIRNKCFYSFRFLEKYWKIAIDATNIYTFKEKHCEHCLTRTYNKGTENEKTIYFHYVLEAKLIIGSMAFSLATEFIENPKGDFDKQDCELKAFYRLAEKIKNRYPKLPICVIFDSLYACQKVFNICKKNKWAYIIRFEEGSIKSVAEDFNGLKKVGNLMKLDNGNTCIFENDIEYRDFKLHLVEYIDKDVEYPFRIYIFCTICQRKFRRNSRGWKKSMENRKHRI